MARTSKIQLSDIIRAYDKVGDHVTNMAVELGCTRQALYHRMRKLGIYFTQKEIKKI